MKKRDMENLRDWHERNFLKTLKEKKLIRSRRAHETLYVHIRHFKLILYQ